MQAEAELWSTALFNRFLAGPLDSFLNAIGISPADPAHPWENWITMEILVVAIIVVVFAVLRSRLSVDRPGKLQLTFEAAYKFVIGQTDEAVEHGRKYAPFFGALFIFILFMNVIGVIPGFQSPTQTVAVPLGLAVTVFLYYHWMGLREQGLGRYLIHFAGPMPYLAPVMIPIELISHFSRPLSLTVRLFANMFAGEKITLTFLALTFLVAPAVFMGLHVFVAFLQAYIFMLLAMIYVSGAVAHEEH
ncbi:MAG TPA: F0F1 ATP synthase subunit A [Bryobacteraceae bacterium]|nr:F0F1 ATP synthase subunit A [Bryobacteraceae bacterium]